MPAFSSSTLICSHCSICDHRPHVQTRPHTAPQPLSEASISITMAGGISHPFHFANSSLHHNSSSMAFPSKVTCLLNDLNSLNTPIRSCWRCQKCNGAERTAGVAAVILPSSWESCRMVTVCCVNNSWHLDNAQDLFLVKVKLHLSGVHLNPSASRRLAIFPTSYSKAFLDCFMTNMSSSRWWSLTLAIAGEPSLDIECVEHCIGWMGGTWIHKFCPPIRNTGTCGVPWQWKSRGKQVLEPSILKWDFWLKVFSGFRFTTSQNEPSFFSTKIS